MDIFHGNQLMRTNTGGLNGRGLLKGHASKEATGCWLHKLILFNWTASREYYKVVRLLNSCHSEESPSRTVRTTEESRWWG